MESNKDKHISIILTVHNRKDKTIKCLWNVLSQKLPDNYVVSIYVTDDGSTDGTSQTIKRVFPNVHIIKGDGNLFWNRGMKKAWEKAAITNPDYYLWLNDDTILMKDALNRLLLSSIKTNNESIIVGSTMSNDNNGTHTYGGLDACIKHKRISPNASYLMPCATFNGNIVLVPQKVFEKLGFNDTYYRHSFGDIDYGLKATQKGLVNYIAPGYYGICNRNNPIPIFRRKCYPLIKRYKLLYSPLGSNPIEAYHLNIKYYPFYLCVWIFIKLHINVLFAVNHMKYEH